MKSHKATYSVILFTDRPKQSGVYPLKLRLTFKRERKYYGLNRDLSIDEWKQLNSGKVKGVLRDLRSEIVDIEEKAKRIVEEFEKDDEEFSFIRFEKLFFDQHDSPTDIFGAFDAHISTLTDHGQISSATSYKCAKTSLNSFLNGRKYKFKEIDSKLLSQYQKWMISENKNTISTVGIYMRNLRTLFNQAKKDGIIKAEQYPFGKGEYVIPIGQSSDKGLNKKTLGLLYHHKSDEEYSNEEKYKDYWFFLYLCNGMNVKDMLRLKFSNIHNELIVFRRAKTENSAKQEMLISVIINDEIVRIINKWGNDGKDKDNYIFNHFFKGLTPVDERRISQNVTGLINDWMNKISKKLELGVTITTYSARHSHSNRLKDENAPLKLIADALGHANIKTTENHYLSEYDFEKRKGYSEKLLNFD